MPALGKQPLAAVERQHVMALHESLCKTPAMANMVVETLSHMYALAKGWDMVPEDCDDPCRSIPMNPKRKRERFLTDAEFTRLGRVLDEVSGKGSRISAGAVATVRASRKKSGTGIHVSKAEIGPIGSRLARMKRKLVP